MTKLEQAARQACQTPLKDLLRSVPKDGRDCYEEDSTCHHFIPYGRLIHEALAEIERLEALAEPQITTPDVCGEVCARAKLCYGCNKDLEEANAKYAEQAEQSQLADATLEREACAKVAETWDFNVQGLVKAIRARGEK